jgi:hypothetical protein
MPEASHARIAYSEIAAGEILESNCTVDVTPETSTSAVLCLEGETFSDYCSGTLQRPYSNTRWLVQHQNWVTH